jgi:hypothetical protein
MSLSAGENPKLERGSGEIGLGAAKRSKRGVSRYTAFKRQNVTFKRR